MPAQLHRVQSWMRWWGWTKDGGPGAVKLNSTKVWHWMDSRVIAVHGDATWLADVNRAIDIEERQNEIDLQQRQKAGHS